MRIKIEDDFDLKKIADSGQCFRFNECAAEIGGKSGTEESFGGNDSRTFSVAASDRHINIRELGDGNYDLSCSEEDFESFWKNYFDLGLSYSDIRAKIDPESDPYLYVASEYGKGIRILRQDPWEMLISFIISQRKNIPAIKASIEKLCERAGYVIGEDESGRKIYSFPTPERLSALRLEELSACSLGYRDKYVHQAAMDVASGAVDLEAWRELEDAQLMEKLLGLFGVGVKVANCEILFGYHRLDAFPKDVWINKVLDVRYPSGFPFDSYAPYNGVMQQYLFFFSRSEGV
ncbi:MAG: DNA glycosylase [Butyrivibrio sp.]|nr:DNA glycosylase [Butyrivibrio sp.]